MEAELDWREWTDEHERRREAATIRARQVLYEGSRPTATQANETTTANGSDAGERGEQHAVSATAGVGSASDADLLF